MVNSEDSFSINGNCSKRPFEAHWLTSKDTCVRPDLASKITAGADFKDPLFILDLIFHPEQFLAPGEDFLARLTQELEWLAITYPRDGEPKEHA